MHLFKNKEINCSLFYMSQSMRENDFLKMYIFINLSQIYQPFDI